MVEVGEAAVTMDVTTLVTVEAMTIDGDACSNAGAGGGGRCGV
jgi:hypothetical protein